MMAWLYIIVIIFALTFLYASWTAAPWLPMYGRDVERAMCLAQVGKGEKFVDIGAGDGRTILSAAAKGAASKGFEISLLPYLLAKVKIFFFKGENKPKIYFYDLWKASLEEADIVFVFLMPRIMEKLRMKMEKELKPGARVICYTWPMPGWEPAEVSELFGSSKIYLYKR